jgi:hypothetical protein
VSAGELILGILLGLVVNEFCDVSPWLASRIVPVAVRLWTRDPERREIYAEAWQAVINERPGKLFKLGTALTFLVAGAGRAADGRARAALAKRSAALKQFREGDPSPWLVRFGTVMAILGSGTSVLALAGNTLGSLAILLGAVLAGVVFNLKFNWWRNHRAMPRERKAAEPGEDL